MKQTISRSQFHQEFKNCGRGDQFSSFALDKLFDYFEQYEEETGEEIELDVIAICCEYAEDEVENVLQNYNLESIEELENETMVIYQDDDVVIYQQF